MTKKQRIFWMEDNDFKLLKSKALEIYPGKGSLERYLEDIARNQVIIIKCSRRIRIEQEEIGDSNETGKTLLFI